MTETPHKAAQPMFPVQSQYSPDRHLQPHRPKAYYPDPEQMPFCSFHKLT